MVNTFDQSVASWFDRSAASGWEGEPRAEVLVVPAAELKRWLEAGEWRKLLGDSPEA